MNIFRSALLLLGLSPVAGLSSAHAQAIGQNPSLTKTWVIDAGAAYRSLDGELYAVTAAGKGGSYDLSRLGLNNEDTSISARLLWRPSDQWRLELAFDEFDSKGGRANSSQIEFGQITIPKGYELASSLETRIYSTFLGYSILKGPQTEFGGRLGLSILDADASVGGHTYVGGKEISAGSEAIGVTKLVPTLGIFGTYAFNDRLAFEGGVDGVAGSLGAYSGHYLALSGGLKYWLTESFALGGGYRYLDIKTERDGNAIDNGIEVRSHGAYMNVSVGF